MSLNDTIRDSVALVTASQQRDVDAVNQLVDGLLDDGAHALLVLADMVRVLIDLLATHLELDAEQLWSTYATFVTFRLDFTEGGDHG